MKTEYKILSSAWRIFLKYGFHGATIEKIANDACVSKSIIHYYFRSKENLYREVVGAISDGLQHLNFFEYPDVYLTWFLVNELRNNRNMFFDALKNHADIDWKKKTEEILVNAFNSIPPVDFLFKKDFIIRKDTDSLG